MMQGSAGRRFRLLALGLTGAAVASIVGASLLQQPPAPHTNAAAVADRAEQADGSAAYALAQRIGCVDYEPQAHLPTVQSQGTCRIGTTRLYLQTFAKSGNRSSYAQGGPKVGHWTGADIGGTSWVVHVDSASFAGRVKAALGR